MVLIQLAAGIGLTDEGEDRLDDQLSIVFENDVFAGTDGGYTNGIILSYARAWRRLPSEPETQWQFSLGQVMQTPEDIENPMLQPESQPYAGLLFFSIGRSYRWQRNAIHTFSLLGGVVGPASQADHTQIAVHETFSVNKPEGWQHQLQNEPVLNLAYEYRRTVAPRLGNLPHIWDITGYTGIHAGNLVSAAKLGFVSRLGINLPPHPAVSLYRGGIGSVPQVGTNNSLHCFYLLIGIEGYYVVNYLLLEGNTWEDSHGVDLEHAQGAAFAGIAYSWNGLHLRFVMMRGSDQFETQKESSRYGSLTLAWSF